MRRIIAAIGEAVAVRVLPLIVSTIRQEFRKMSDQVNTIDQDVAGLTSVVSQLKDDVSAAVAKIGSLSALKAGDTISSDNEQAIKAAVSALNGMHTSLQAAEMPVAASPAPAAAAPVQGSDVPPASV